MQTLTVSEARANWYRLMDQAAQAHQPITILGKRSIAVLVSAGISSLDGRENRQGAADVVAL